MTLELNRHQMEAVLHYTGPMMVLAGPGSGKTMVITYRIKKLIEEYYVNPNEILVITFTKITATEMRERFIQIVNNKNNANKVTFGTFHAIFFRILRSYYSYRIEDIMQEETKYEILRKIIDSLDIDYEDEKEFLREIISEVGKIKSELIETKYYHARCCSTEDFRKIIANYEQYKEENNLIDFDDMLKKTWELLIHNEEVCALWQKKFRFILVDEFQDINRAQYEIMKILSKPENNLFIVGDDDQAIYEFRGARPEFLLNFPKEFKEAKKLILNINYRSSEHIVALGEKLIKYNQKRYAKNMKTYNPKGNAPIIHKAEDILDEAKLLSKNLMDIRNGQNLQFRNMAVIFRINLQARAIIDVFMDYNIPFITRDRTMNIYEHFIAKDILAYMSLTRDFNSAQDLVKIINKPKRYVSKFVMTKIKKHANDIWKLLLLEYRTQGWMLNRLEKLRYHLQMMKNKKPEDIIHYIRKTINYEEYLVEYAQYRKIGVKGLIGILDELQESAKNHSTCDDWIAHIHEFTARMEESYKNKKRKHDAVTLTTLHSSKGLEYDLVWLVGAIEGVIPHEKSSREKDIEEERRLFYVGMTRAKKYLHISYTNSRYGDESQPSRFIDEILVNEALKRIETGTKT